MSRDATGIWSARAVALTSCPVCKARKGVACDRVVEGYEEHNTHFARTEQPISARRSNAYMFPDDKYKKGLVAVGALGVFEGRTPAYVEAVAVDTLGRRWLWGEYGYEWPIDYDPSDVVMVPLPSLPTNYKKHVLLLGTEELETLSGWREPPTKAVAKFVAWIREGADTDKLLGACRLDEGAAWLTLPRQSEAVLTYLSRDLVKRLQEADIDSDEVERLAWRLQRCARGGTAYMAHAAVAFESVGRRDFSEAMESACTASPKEWKRSMRRAAGQSKRWREMWRKAIKESLRLLIDRMGCVSPSNCISTLASYQQTASLGDEPRYAEMSKSQLAKESLRDY